MRPNTTADIDRAIEICKNLAESVSCFDELLKSYDDYKQREGQHPSDYPSQNKNFDIYADIEISDVIQLLQVDYPKFFFYTIWQLYEIEAMTVALDFEYYPHSVIQIENTNNFLVFFKKDSFSPSMTRNNDSILSKQCNIIYTNDRDSYLYTAQPQFLPKFVHLVQRKCNNDIKDKIINSCKVWKSYESISKCYAYYHAGENHNTSSRLFQGDASIKKSISELKLSLDFHNRYDYFADSPAIIIDTDIMKAVSFYTKEDKAICFLLDEYFLAYRLDEGYIKKICEEKANMSVYSIYKRAIDKLNKKMLVWKDEIESNIFKLPGKRYHLSIAEKKYFLNTLIPVMLLEKHRTVRQEEIGMCLNPCLFNMEPYLDKLVSESIIIPVINDNDEKKKPLKYTISDKTSITAICIFSIIMNAYIAEQYNNLTDSEKEKWDMRYEFGSWENIDIPEDELKNKTELVKKTKYKWRKTKLIETLEGKVNGKEFSIRQEFQFRIGYFSKLFSIDADKLRISKSYAISKFQPGQLQGENRFIVDLILCVNHDL